MQKFVFRKRVSKGTKFNQIYVPKELEECFQPNDLVEVRLLEKNTVLHINNTELTEFKKWLVKKIFSFLQKFKINQIFVVGSFLTQKTDYNDIDIVLIGSKQSEEKIYNDLTDEFNLKFHVLNIKKENLENLLKICPLTKAMLDKFVSNKKFKPPLEIILDEKHLSMLLMMPEDLLEIELNSRVYYDNIRRLLTIEKFLMNESLSSEKINEDLKKELKNVYEITRNNEIIDKENLKFLRDIIKKKITIIKKMLNG